MKRHLRKDGSYIWLSPCGMGTSSGLCGCLSPSAWLASLAAWPSNGALAPGSVQPAAPISSWYTVVQQLIYQPAASIPASQQPVHQPASSQYIASHHHTNQPVTNNQSTSCTIIQPHSCQRTDASHPSMQPSALLSRQPPAPATSVASITKLHNVRRKPIELSTSQSNSLIMNLMIKPDTRKRHTRTNVMIQVRKHG